MAQGILVSTDAHTSVTDARSTVKESYVLLDTSTTPPQFVTVSGDTTPHGHLAEKFPSEKEAKKAKRVWARIQPPLRQEAGHVVSRMVVARMTEVHTYALTWEEPKP